MHEAHMHHFTERHGTFAAKANAGERRMWMVVGITFVMMVAELVVGYATGSLALLADGIHMATHVGALGLSGVAYALARRWGRDEAFSFGGPGAALLANQRVIGSTALVMIFESVRPLLAPRVLFGRRCRCRGGLGRNILARSLATTTSATIRQHDHGSHDIPRS